MPFNMSEEDIRKFFREFYYPTLDYYSLPKNYDNPQNVNRELCSECKGFCCKQCGCHFSPDDFKDLSFEGLKKEIEKGYISIELVDGEVIYSDINIFILRTRNNGAPIVDFGYRRNQCILLGENGCKLNYKSRPSGGKLLIPKENKKCYQTYNINDCCKEWLPHKKLLKDLADYFEDKDIPCSL